MSATRIQMTLGYTLQAEVICESLDEADRIWHRFVNLKYKRNLPCGGAVIQRADLPRTWDIPVGSEIK